MKKYAPSRYLMRGVLPMIMITVLAAACGEVGSDPDVNLPVPFRSQADGSLDCAPASVLMLRLAYGLSENPPSLQAIKNWMGTTGGSGTDWPKIADGINHFTWNPNTNEGIADAIVDLWGNTPAQSKKYFSRQITSIDNGVPLIPIITFNHAVVLKGGLWHENADGDNQWDYVYVHNALLNGGGPNLQHSGSSWELTTCSPNGSGACTQIASVSAMGGWAGNLANYGDTVVLGGGGSGGGPCGGQPCDA